MLSPDRTVSPDVARAIQLALAPVFLLTGIATILNVVSGRLGRIIDRGRRLVESPSIGAILSPDQIANSLHSLERRRRLVSAAITACTLSALFVCMVIFTLFMEAFFGVHLKWLQGILFTASTLALVVGLSLFLREIHLATGTVRIELQRAAPKPTDAA